MVYILGDVLTRIKLAQKLHRGSVEVRSSRLVLDVLRIMYTQGAILGFTIVTKRSEVKVIVYLKYHEGLAVIKGLHLVSTPGYRKYLTLGEFLRRYFKGSSQGFYILSTPKGLVSSLELFVNTNNNLNVTGEILLRVVY